MAQTDTEIARLRSAIDELDRRIVELLNERAGHVLDVRRAKDDAKIEQYDPEREARIYESLAGANGGPLSDDDLRRIYKTILDVMKTFE